MGGLGKKLANSSKGKDTTKDPIEQLFGSKGKSLFDRISNIQDAIREINPNYKNEWKTALPSDTSRGSEYDKYARNCALCSTAGALQLLGYDVEAMPRDTQWRGFNEVFDVDWSNYDNMLSPRDDTYWSYYEGGRGFSKFDNWMKSIKNPNKVGTTSNKVANQIDKFMEKSGTNSFAELSVAWKGGRSAHSLMVYRDDSRTTVIDFQNGKTYSGVDAIKGLLNRTQVKATTLTRLDNVPFKANLDKSTIDKMIKKKER